MSASPPEFYWPLSEPAGATEAGNIAKSRSERLVVTGSGADVVFGSAGGPATAPTTAAEFGAGKYLAIATDGTPGHVAPFQARTICAFVTVPSAPAAQATVLELTGTGAALSVTFGLYVRTDGKLETFFNGTLVGATNIADGQLHHAAVWLGSGSTVRLYLDGALDADNSNVTFSVDYTSVVVGRAFTGAISHVAIRAAALDASRINDHWLAGSTGFAGESSDARIRRYAKYAGVADAEMDI